MAAQHLYCLERGCAAEDIYFIDPDPDLRVVVALDTFEGNGLIGYRSFDEATAAVDGMPLEVLENGSPLIIRATKIGKVYPEQAICN